MTKKLLFGLLVLTLVALPLLAACEEEVTPPGEEEEEGPPGEEEEEVNWWDALGEPQYGDTITIRLANVNPSFDPYQFMPGDWHMVYETLVSSDWTVDPAEWSFKVDYIPMEYIRGFLAESWEFQDPTTMVVTIREGVRWQNKPPVNGREFNAYDVEYHYHRILALGSGFTEPSPMYVAWYSTLEGVTATDENTVIFEFNKPGIMALWQFMEQTPMNLIEPRESVEAGGGKITDWQLAVGTGAWMLADFVPGTSMTFDKNPDYWGYDERHPENQLPYADTLKALVIPDLSTAIAALRTGQVDAIGAATMAALNWQQAQTLKQSNPELEVVALPAGGPGFSMRVDKAPFTDIRVRKALNMAIDRETLAESYYGGTVDGIPAGFVLPDYQGFCFPYDEWTQELKDEYSFEPEEAMELLAEAAADGVFEVNEYGGFDTSCLAATPTADLQLLQAIQAMFLDIGVVMEIEVMENAALMNLCFARQNEAMVFGGGTVGFKPANSIYHFFSQDVRQNWCAVADPTYDALLSQFESALTEDEAAQACKEADKLSLEQHWKVQVFPIYNYVVYQPYLKGYEGAGSMWNAWLYTARWWIDQELKESLGH